ncbi:MAG: ATPase [Saprospiraceae bacterium]
MTYLCISCYFKGGPFLRAAKAAGHTVYLLTAANLKNADWPRDAVDVFFYLEEDNNGPQNLANIAKGLGWIMRENVIDRIVALDDFDVEKAAYLREEFRLPGMGQTTARYFRDKLAMRICAKDAGVPVPAFSALFNDAAVNKFIAEVAPPWLVKPRGEASATGIRKVHSGEELWQVIHDLGDARSQHLVEQFRPGDVYHADALSVDGEVIFCQVSRYLSTPLEVAHGGGIFRSVSVEYGSEDDRACRAMTSRVMKAFGMKFSASHTEFIRLADGSFTFLETASRVGGAHLAEMVEAASGISLWAEWAKVEDAMSRGVAYQLPQRRHDHAGIIVSLSRYKNPDDSSFTDPEIVWRMTKDHHIGLIVSAPDTNRVHQLLEDYAGRISRDFHASAPAPKKSLH